MSPRKIGVTELVLRDAHQSLMATRMAMEDMVDACADIDAAGFWSVECWGGATFDSCIRFLNEDPWVRLRTFRELMPNTRLQMLLRGQNGSQAKLCWNASGLQYARRLHCTAWKAPAGWQRGQKLGFDGHYLIDDRSAHAGESGFFYWR